MSNPVDVPVTDLDYDEDVISSDASDVDVLDDDFAPRKQSGVSKTLTKIKNALKTDHSLTREEIELQELGRHSNNEDYLTRKTTPTHKISFVASVLAFMVIIVWSLVGVANRQQRLLIEGTYSSQKPRFSNGTDEYYPTTILISLDGFHPHYVSPELTPHMHKLYQRLYGPPYMMPSFPLLTFPNHYTMITGLYPAYHGIVGNTFFDPKEKKQFVNVESSKSLSREWWGGEPIWQTAFFHGVSTAVHMWPGSEVDFGVGRPLEFDVYNGSEVLLNKVERILGWIDRKIEERPELILGYAPTIDLLGHRNGVAGEDLEHGLRYVDNFVESITEGLKARNLSNIVNLIIVSDHGMAPTSDERIIYIDDIVDLKKIQHFDGWPLFGLRPFTEYLVDDVYQEIQKNMEKHSVRGLKAYKKQDMPPEWNFGTTDSVFEPRIAPLWLVPEVGYVVAKKKEVSDNGGSYRVKGVHGYNNTEVLMRALFMGTGPYFEGLLGSAEKGRKVEPFFNTELYNIVCELLNIKGAPNNGTQGSLQKLLKEDWTDPTNYPGVDYKIDILPQNSTYDMLYRKGKHEKIGVDIPEDPALSMASIEKEYGTIPPASVPGATFVPDNEDSKDNKEDDKEDDNKDDNKDDKDDGDAENETDELWFNKVEHFVEGVVETLEEDTKEIIGEVGKKIHELQDSYNS